MDAIYENGTFWNCWSGDYFVALCTKGPDFQQPRTSIPKWMWWDLSELRQFTLAVWTAAFHRKRKKKKINLVFSDHIKASSLCNKVEKLSSLQCWLWFEIVKLFLQQWKMEKKIEVLKLSSCTVVKALVEESFCCWQVILWEIYVFFYSRP